jgi:hypothetical protein
VYFLSLSITYESKGFSRFSVGTGTKEVESTTGRVLAAGFNQVTTCSRFARVFKLMNRLFLKLSKFYLGRGKPWVVNQHTGAQLYTLILP